jgi:CheY-like chemotaxis protein
MRANLEGFGLQVDVANDGAEAVQMAMANRYSLIFMDMRMPVLNGLDAVRAIRRDPGAAGVPILVTTANDQDQDRRACTEAGANEHLAKPITTEHLIQALGRWLPTRSAD